MWLQMEWLFDFVFVDVLHLIAFDHCDSNDHRRMLSEVENRSCFYFLFSLGLVAEDNDDDARCLCHAFRLTFFFNERTNNQKPTNTTCGNGMRVWKWKGSRSFLSRWLAVSRK